jgi:RNA polymerase sporulation-specific sigma factor
MEAVAFKGADIDDESSIISAAQQGDTDAIEYLLKKYKRIVLSCVESYYLPWAEKEDLIQEGMIALYGAIKGFNYRYPFPSFAKTCVIRKLYSVIRLQNSLKHKLLTNAVCLNKPVYDNGNRTLFDTMPGKNADPCDLISEIDERKWIVNQARKNLTELEKQVLKLYLNGLSYRDIADTLNLKPKTVDNALQRAKRKLRDVLNAQRED